MQQSTLQPDNSDKPAKQPSPSQAAGIFGFWSIFASVSLILILVLVLIAGIRRKQRLKRLGARKPGRTRYIDAWAEAGSRMKTPDDLDDLIDSPPPDSDGNFGPGDSRRPPRAGGNS